MDSFDHINSAWSLGCYPFNSLKIQDQPPASLGIVPTRSLPTPKKYLSNKVMTSHKWVSRWTSSSSNKIVLFWKNWNFIHLKETGKNLPLERLLQGILNYQVCKCLPLGRSLQEKCWYNHQMQNTYWGYVKICRLWTTSVTTKYELQIKRWKQVK